MGKTLKTALQNINYMAEIDVATARRIRKAVESGKKTQKEIAEKYGASVSTVRKIAKMSAKEFEEYIAKKKEKARKAKKGKK